MAEISVGIDLGTTNSCISTCWPNGQPRLLRDGTGVGVIPSVVSFTDDSGVEVGTKARMRLLTDAENTFFSTKRFIGRDMRLEENRWAASLYPYTIEAGQNGIPLAVTRGNELPIYQISGQVLRHLKQIAEQALEQTIDKAVITVPANFNEVQRRSTHQAGEFAGFEVLRIFNEPTAAALAYGLGREERRIVAVYDFGGGTFDITILRLEDPVFEVLATSGDMMLGGDDFDRRILEDMFESFRAEYGFGGEDDVSLSQRFMLGAERMKCQLTDWIVTAFEDRHVRKSDGTTLPPFHYELNRERFRTLVGELVDRSLSTCDEAFELAGMSPRDVDEVILVGGTTRVPFLREKVKDYFGRQPLSKIQPDVVVSIGAAIQAYALAGGDLVHPARDGDMLPIRKVEPRPPAPRPRTGSDMELLDDLSDDMIQDEKESMRRLAGGSTMRAVAPPAPSSPPPAPPPQRPSSRPPPAPSRPPAPPGPEVGSDRRAGQTLRYAPPVPPPAGRPAEPEDLPAPRRSDDDGEFGLPEPFGVRPSSGRPSGEPAPPDEMQSTQRLSSEPGPAAGAPPARSSSPPAPSYTGPEFRHPDVIAPDEGPAAGRQAREEPDAARTGAAATGSAAVAAVGQAEASAPQAPVVTPETTSQPFVSGDVLRQMDAGEQEQEQDREPAPAPLLLDVTPHTLGVATVGGYVEVLVHKNSPVPIEKAHLFTTSVDDQDRAVIKVLEGESPRAEENHVLGEVELPDIRKAPRGEIKIEVTYEITVDGILQVSGRNLETGEAQTARLTLFGG